MSDTDDLQHDAEESLWDNEPQEDYCAICAETHEPQGDLLTLTHCAKCKELVCLDCLTDSMLGKICLACSDDLTARHDPGDGEDDFEE